MRLIFSPYARKSSARIAIGPRRLPVTANIAWQGRRDRGTPVHRRRHPFPLGMMSLTSGISFMANIGIVKITLLSPALLEVISP